MIALQRDQEIPEVEPQVPKEGITGVRTLLFITGKIPRGQKRFLRNGDLRVDTRVVDGDEIRVQIVPVGDGFDGVNVGKQRLHHLSLKVSGLSHQLLVVGDNAHPGLDNLYRTPIHNDTVPMLSPPQYF